MWTLLTKTLFLVIIKDSDKTNDKLWIRKHRGEV